MKTFVPLLLLLTLLSSQASSTSEISVYGGGPLYPENNPDFEANMKILKESGFNTLVAWTVHVYSEGHLVFNGFQIASEGKYTGHPKWPVYLADLKSEKSFKKIILSVGSAGVKDYESIRKLIREQGTGPDSILYKNFAALKAALPVIDAIDFDNEEAIDHDTMVKFSLLLGSVGFKVSFCPYYGQNVWINILKDVESQHAGLVTQFNLQCYEGGGGNDPVQWQDALHQNGFKIPVIAGLECEQLSGDSPSRMQDKFKSWGSRGINGGFIWLFDNLLKNGPSAAEYAAAIKKGLESSSTANLRVINK